MKKVWSLPLNQAYTLHPDDESVDKKWRGIGIRIEDDVVATSKGPRVLTADVVKNIADIEHLMAQAKS